MTELSEQRQFITIEETQCYNISSSNLITLLGRVINYIQNRVTEKIPVGSVILSFLENEKFFSIKDPTKWYPCDGRSCVGTDYHTLTGKTTVPDLRNYYLRGKRNGRSDGKGDQNERSLGYVEPVSTFPSHSHYLIENLDANDTVCANATIGHGHMGSTDIIANLSTYSSNIVANLLWNIIILDPNVIQGGNEPKRAAVSTFIKVNY